MTELVKPSAEYNRKAVIRESLCARRTSVEIIKFFGCPKSTVYDVAKKYAASERFEKGSSPVRKVQVRKKSTRTPEIIQRVQDMILEDLGTSLQKLASVLGASETIVHRIAREDLRYTSYILKVRQKLSEAAKLKRLAQKKKLSTSSVIRKIFRRVFQETRTQLRIIGGISFRGKIFQAELGKKRVTVSRRGESLVRYDKYGNTLELKVRLSR
ncbi:hypothetical protein ANTPLA_LOCUS9301 [Anthophora plagiata]